ncbi:S-adenosyl-L-methionine-dependent methyltransferase [Thelonectria olida]|uniref:S-adenosyl-L-methionine-dependent methyltransferase n=1 Tax=Thelonectria olida TaxID=1576542 RepID=A0A9P9AS45_9HYPO|nr:S-adenosyl-L-methionine-dependent methyltransferase [Thelonectria olida]
MAESRPQMVVDPGWYNETDNDSVLSSEPASSTTSLSASILDYRKLHGRTYQNFNTGTEYWGPNDERQNEALDLTHHMLYIALDDKLFLAPIGENPQRVIDIGTGTGIWAIDFADQFPSAEVIGTDLSPIQPSWVPANCRFELDDAQLPWAYPDNHFDYIHIRCLMGSITDWPALYREIHRCLKPGGWFEHQDYSIDVVSDDDSVPKGSPLDGWGALFQEAGDRMGRTFNIIENGRNVEWFKGAGFERIGTHRFKLPLGGWPADPKWKEVGQYNLTIVDESLEGYVLFLLTNVMGWDYAKVQAFIAETRKTLRDRSMHAYCDVGTVWGQKAAVTADPETETAPTTTA